MMCSLDGELLGSQVSERRFGGRELCACMIKSYVVHTLNGGFFIFGFVP